MEINELERAVKSLKSADCLDEVLTYLSAIKEEVIRMEAVVKSGAILNEKYGEIKKSNNFSVMDIVGTCDRCNNLSKELWEIYENGQNRAVCRDCIAKGFGSYSALEGYLRGKKKVLAKIERAEEGEKNNNSQIIEKSALEKYGKMLKRGGVNNWIFRG